MVGIDPATLDARASSTMMTSLVVPRPIAWVSTVDAAGNANLAPHSYFNAVSGAPPVLMFSSTHSSRFHADRRKDTLRNVEATGEFVVNLVSEDLLAAMNVTSAAVPPEVDEFALAGLAKRPAIRVKPPLVAAARVALECRLHSLSVIGDATVVFGTVVYAQVAAEIWRDGQIDIERLRPVSRLGGVAYATVGSIIDLPRPDGSPYDREIKARTTP